MTYGSWARSVDTGEMHPFLLRAKCHCWDKSTERHKHLLAFLWHMGANRQQMWWGNMGKLTSSLHINTHTHRTHSLMSQKALCYPKLNTHRGTLREFKNTHTSAGLVRPQALTSAVLCRTRVLSNVSHTKNIVWLIKLFLLHWLHQYLLFYSQHKTTDVLQPVL